jgi:hypothetical protein
MIYELDSWAIEREQIIADSLAFFIQVLTEIAYSLRSLLRSKEMAAG